LFASLLSDEEWNVSVGRVILSIEDRDEYSVGPGGLGRGELDLPTSGIAKQPSDRFRSLLQLTSVRPWRDLDFGTDIPGERQGIGIGIRGWHSGPVRVSRFEVDGTRIREAVNRETLDRRRSVLGPSPGPQTLHHIDGFGAKPVAKEPVPRVRRFLLLAPVEDEGTEALVLAGQDRVFLPFPDGLSLLTACLFQRNTPFRFGNLPVSSGAPFSNGKRFRPVLAGQFGHCVDVAIAIDAQQIHGGALTSNLLHFLLEPSRTHHGQDRMVSVDAFDRDRQVGQPFPQLWMMRPRAGDMIQFVANGPEHDCWMILQFFDHGQDLTLLLGHLFRVSPINITPLSANWQVGHDGQAFPMGRVVGRLVRPGADGVPAASPKSIEPMPANGSLDVEGFAVLEKQPAITATSCLPSR
jgi:hypothetical protein